MRKRRLKRRLAEAARGEISALDDTVASGETRSGCGWRSRPSRSRSCSGMRTAALSVEEFARPGATSAPVTRTLELRGPPPGQLVLRAVPLRQHGDCLGTVGVVDDVSERRQLEAVRRDFVANVSHELRAPVGALALPGDALTGETDLVVVSRLAHRITAEADRAARMTEDLLDLSRIEAGVPVDGRQVSVESVVAAAVERAQPGADLREVRLVVATDPTTDVHVVGDEVQLVSAVADLVDNAR